MADEPEPITGGCMCGAVRYESTKPPVGGSYCHCRMCQQAYGALFGTFADFSEAAFRYTKGEPTYHQSSAWARRGFCGTCGTPIEFKYLESSEKCILIGTLDHPEDFPPTLNHSGIESKVPWVVITDDLPQQRMDESPYYLAATPNVRAAEAQTARMLPE